MAQILKYGSTGAPVDLLQLALNRAGASLAIDGIFGSATRTAVQTFQRARGMSADGVVGARTTRALLPYYTGYDVHIIRSGDTLYRLAAAYGTTIRAIETANPSIDPLSLRVGQMLAIPLDFPVVPTNIRYSSTAISYIMRGLTARYPFLTVGEFGKSVLGRPLWYCKAGTGENLVFYNASHHANEWITTPVLLKFVEDLAAAYAFGGSIDGKSAAELLGTATLYIAPAVNPDGIDLVTGALDAATVESARRLAANYPAIPFPDGWKANIRGVDLNLQYPAGWSLAKEIKFEQGYTQPGPRDYVGSAPLVAPESRAMYDYTLALSPRLTLSYHTQGRVIFWKYANYEPEGSRAIAQQFAAASGYAVEETPYASGHAGYKDWFIQDFNRPGYTIEAGLGENPLPLSQFDTIYRENIGILTLGMTASG